MPAARSTTASRRSGRWDLDVGAGGVVVARHTPSGARITASLALRAEQNGAAFRTVRFDYSVPGGVVTDGPAAPIEWLEDAVNEPGMMQVVLDSLSHAPVDAGDILPMRLPAAMLERRERPDAFYSHLAALVRICTANRISYGPRIAADNNVSEGTVRSWVHEARKRGLLDQPRGD